MSDRTMEIATKRLEKAMGVEGRDWDVEILMLNAAVRIDRLQAERKKLRGGLEAIIQAANEGELFHDRTTQAIHKWQISRRGSRPTNPISIPVLAAKVRNLAKRALLPVGAIIDAQDAQDIQDAQE